jgi:BirA family biotin operon repressor/biotin-[acetyl-CoA-carboxylase] ligase
VAPTLPGFTVEVLPTIDSTNTDLMRRARAGQCEPVLLVAERQSAGRGRLGRDWQSDAHGLGGTLTFSIGMPLTPVDWSGLSLAVGLSLVQSLHPALQLKWPNDIWWNDRKVAGILIETASTVTGVGVGAKRYAVIGVGINITPRDGQDMRTPPACLQDVLPGVCAPDVLEHVIAPLLRDVQRFCVLGFAPLVDAFNGRDALKGRAVVCTDGLRGVAHGVDASGALLVHTEQEIRKITSAEVSVRPLGPATDGMN